MKRREKMAQKVQAKKLLVQATEFQFSILFTATMRLYAVDFTLVI